MPPDTQPDTIAALVDLVAQLAREKDEPRKLLAAFGRGEITSEQVVNHLAAQYQTGIGGTVRALAEYDKDAAQRLGQRLRQRLEAALAEIAAADVTALPAHLASVVPDGTSERADGPAQFNKRDADKVLLREHVLVSALTLSDAAVRSADLITAAKSFESGIRDEAVTAHLIRLFLAGIIGKERKGRYHGTAQTRSHLADLSREIEARGLKPPPTPVIAA